MVQYTAKENLPALFISLDYEKDFNRVDFQAMFNIVKWFNFGNQLIKWVKLLFTDMQLAAINNGYTSEYNSPTHGLFQGNPVVSFLFILLIVLLATRIRNNSKIKGIKIKDQEILLAMFADDMGILLDFDQQSWTELEIELNKFQDQSRMLINYDKTEVYHIGSLQNSNATMYSQRKLHWTNDPVKVLGIVITHKNEKILTLNI